MAFSLTVLIIAKSCEAFVEHTYCLCGMNLMLYDCISYDNLLSWETEHDAFQFAICRSVDHCYKLRQGDNIHVENCGLHNLQHDRKIISDSYLATDVVMVALSCCLPILCMCACAKSMQTFATNFVHMCCSYALYFPC